MKYNEVKTPKNCLWGEIQGAEKKEAETAEIANSKPGKKMVDYKVIKVKGKEHFKKSQIAVKSISGGQANPLSLRRDP